VSPDRRERAERATPPAPGGARALDALRRLGAKAGPRVRRAEVTARELPPRQPRPASGRRGGGARQGGKETLDWRSRRVTGGAAHVQVRDHPRRGRHESEKERRLVTFDVARERVRVCKSQVRRRRWSARSDMLTSDASIRPVAFHSAYTDERWRATRTDGAHPFSGRTSSSPNTAELRPRSLLQDFDAQPYGLEKNTGEHRKYVRRGGGIRQVGGQKLFSPRGYAGTAARRRAADRVDARTADERQIRRGFEPSGTDEDREP